MRCRARGRWSARPRSAPRRRAAREARDEGEVVDHQGGGVGGQPGGVVEDDRDVPAVEGVLVEAQAGELVEAEGQRPHGEGQACPLALVHGLERPGAGPRRRPARRRPGPAASWRSTRPTPTARSRRGLASRPDVLEPAAHDDRTRPEMRQHLARRTTRCRRTATPAARRRDRGTSSCRRPTEARSAPRGLSMGTGLPAGGPRRREGTRPPRQVVGQQVEAGLERARRATGRRGRRPGARRLSTSGSTWTA